MLDTASAIKYGLADDAHDIRPDTANRNQTDEESSADMFRCWTCGSCDFECPVNIFTHRLRPQKIVRMANLGLVDELVALPEIWYCISCRRCGQICPHAVKPWALIEYVRSTAMFRRNVPWKTVQTYKAFWIRFQRVRWQVVRACLHGGEIQAISDQQWHAWLDNAIAQSNGTIRQGVGIPYPEALKEWSRSYLTTNCYTCSECSSACPVACEVSLFDPKAIVRMVNLGMLEELLVSPAIWLCLGCRRCSESCSQLVDNANLIRTLQELALSSGAVDVDFKIRLEFSMRAASKRLIEEIDRVLGLSTFVEQPRSARG